MLTSISIPFLPEYYKEFVAKNNTSAKDRIWNLSTFRGGCLIHLDHWGILIINLISWYYYSCSS